MELTNNQSEVAVETANGNHQTQIEAIDVQKVEREKSTTRVVLFT